MNDKDLRGTALNRTFISVPMSEDMKARITKAAGRNELSTARYIRDCIVAYMTTRGDWSIPGPTKGNR